MLGGIFGFHTQRPAKLVLAKCMRISTFGGIIAASVLICLAQSG